jgi:hypothetical protein|nr:hypothetical protein [Kofleriaceae bacterium]
MSEILDPSLIEAFFRARSVADVDDLLRHVERAASCVWLPVGGSDMNVSSIEPGTNPPLQLIERVVNGFDGWLELMKARNPSESPSSPFEAVRKWGDVPTGGLRMLGDKKTRELAEKTVRVMMADSGIESKPTVIVRDFGIGVHADDFLTTVLSIHGKNKREKPYLHGAFGHGAATTLKFSEYTIIGSRAAPELVGDREDVVGVTVIRFRPPRGSEKFGVYEYLATEQGAILRAPAITTGDTFRITHGVYVAHVAYDLKNYTADYKREKSGLWGLLNSVLFDPALPVHMTGERSKDLAGDPRANTTGRIAAGNAALLQSRPVKAASKEPVRGASLRLSDTFPLQLSADDAVEVEFWVLDRDAETYVNADQQLTVTLNGQRHTVRGRPWFKRLKFSYLSRVMVVHVRADGLSYNSRRLTFSTLREADVKEGYLEEVVLKEVGDHLANDKRLQALEEELHEEDLARAADKASDSLRRRVAQRMDRALKGAGFSGLKVTNEPDGAVNCTTNKPGDKPGAPPKPPRPPTPPRPLPDDSHLKFVPVTMKLDPGPHEIRRGGGAHLVLELDAKNDYLPNNRASLRVAVRDASGEESANVKFRGMSRLLGGECRLYFFAIPEAQLATVDVEVHLTTQKGMLRAASKLNVVEAPAMRAPPATTVSGLPQIQWLKREEWPPEWSEHEVGDVQVSREAVSIRLNEEYAPLRAAVERRKGKAISTFKNRYLVSSAVGLWMQEVFIEDKHTDSLDNAMKEARRWIAAAAIEGIETLEDPPEEEE